MCVNYRENRAAADAVVRDIEQAGGRAIAVVGNVAREADVMRLFETVDRQLGALTALVNNAAILGIPKRVDELTLEALEEIMDTNVIGSLLCAREAVRRMSTRHGGEGGAIVNLSSTAAHFGAPHEHVDYAASKGAIESFTTGLAREVAAEGIRVNCVRPGIIDTEIHASSGDPDRVERLKQSLPMKRAGQPEEIAYAILWLLSDEASYAAGAIVDLTGGR